MKVLSLFDGMSCGMIALERLSFKVDKYYASEIDKAAIKVSSINYPSIVRIGDVTKVSYKEGILYTEFGEFEVGDIDLLLAGSPCQSISTLGDGTGLDGKSGLFYEFLRIKDEVKPTNYLLENVCGNKKAVNTISQIMGVQPIHINSALVSAQTRNRLYWTDIKGVELPYDKGLHLQDVLEEGLPELSILTPGRAKWVASEKAAECFAKKYAVLDPKKANCLTARSDASWNSNYVTRQGQVTRLTPTEYERLQTVPEGYTKAARTSERYKMLGNGWTVDVIAHILSYLKADER